MASPCKKRFKSRNKRSWVWAHFEEDNTKTTVSEKWVTCLIKNYAAPSLLAKDGNTTVMSNHLALHHKLSKPLNDYDGDVSTEVSSENRVEYTKEYQNIIDSKLAKFVSSSHSPLSLVENDDFVDFISSLHPKYKLPGRALLRDLILQEADVIRKKLQQRVRNTGDFSFCLDLWKSKARDYYISITIHFIDDEWNLIYFPIAFQKIVGPHTAEAIGNLVADLLKPLLDNNSPFAGVVDGGDISSVKFTDWVVLFETKRVSVTFYIIKRIVNDYFEDIYLLEWRQFVKRIRKSHPFAESWDQCCDFCYQERIVLQVDTETRWSSTVAMIAKAYRVREAVLSLGLKVRDEDKEFVPDWGDMDSEAWAFLGQIAELFEPTLKAIQVLEGSKYVTQSLILLEMCLMESSIQNMDMQIWKLKMFPRRRLKQVYSLVCSILPLNAK
jgi:hypothetical protein